MSLYRRALKQYGRTQEIKAQRKERLETCKKCKFFNHNFGTCGTPYTGEEVTFYRKKYRTCGCIMATKTWLPFAECPVGKWLAMDGFGEEYKQEVIDTLAEYDNKPDKDNLRKVFALYKKILGSAGHHINPNDLSCGYCKNNRIKELRDFVKRLDKC